MWSGSGFRWILLVCQLVGVPCENNLCKDYCSLLRLNPWFG